jgi:hypothetical protein
MIVEKIIEKAPIIFQPNGFTNLAMNVTNCTDPISASIMASKLIIGACVPPQVKYPAKCAILALQLGMCICTGGWTS